MVKISTLCFEKAFSYEDGWEDVHSVYPTDGTCYDPWFDKSGGLMRIIWRDDSGVNYKLSYDDGITLFDPA